MMKHTIEFDISGDEQWEEKRRLELMMKADEMSFVIWDITQILRNEIKYNEDLSPETFEKLSEMQSLILSAITERNLDFVLEDL